MVVDIRASRGQWQCVWRGAAVGLSILLAGCAASVPAGGKITPLHDGPGHGPGPGRIGDHELLSVRLTTSHPSESLPVIRLNTSDTFNLQFDIAGDIGRPWSIRFVPATIDWEPSYAPEPETLPAPDEIFDYDTSNTTDFLYVHYNYEFPNPRVSFYRSGNYIVEVYDGGSGQSVFDRRFCITDEEVPVDLSSESWSLLTDQPDELRPEVRIDVPNDPWVPTDALDVRFIKNGWMDLTLPSGLPKVEGGTYVYTPEDTFPFTRKVFRVNLPDPTQIHRRDDIELPVTLNLFPDDYRFFREDYQLSSPIPRLTDTEYDSYKEYARVNFYLAKAPAGNAPYLTGSFNDWLIDPKLKMKWDSREGAYVLEVLLKNEEQFYSYHWEGEGLAANSKFDGPNEVSFTAFVYVKDSRYPTHRLWTVASKIVSE